MSMNIEITNIEIKVRQILQQNNGVMIVAGLFHALIENGLKIFEKVPQDFLNFIRKRPQVFSLENETNLNI